MSFTLPPGSCDSHCHVIGPHARFPMVAGAGEIRSDSADAHLALLAGSGLQRALIVHPSSVYGSDHSALLAALKQGGGRYRGVAVAQADVSDATLEAWRNAGVCGLRFVDVRDAQGRAFAGSASLDDLERLAPRMRALGLHAQIWATCSDIVRNEIRILRTNIPVVFDHMGMIQAAAGVHTPDFQRLCAIVREGAVSVKLTLCRNSKQMPAYPDLRPFHDALVDANPAQVVWGSDWPHLRMGASAPDVNGLLELFCGWIGDATIIRKVLVDNPARLFGFRPITEVSHG